MEFVHDSISNNVIYTNEPIDIPNSSIGVSIIDKELVKFSKDGVYKVQRYDNGNFIITKEE